MMLPFMQIQAMARNRKVDVFRASTSSNIYLSHAVSRTGGFNVDMHS